MINSIEPRAVETMFINNDNLDYFLNPFEFEFKIRLLIAGLDDIKRWIAATKSKLIKGYKCDSELNEECKTILAKIITSKVFKEAFNKADYFPNLIDTDNSNIGNNIGEYIIFVRFPATISGLTSYFKRIFITNRWFFMEETNLINAAIIVVVIHELAHFFIRYIEGSKYQKIKTPTKISLQKKLVKEGGVLFEEILFGQNLSFMNTERAKYILDLEKWNGTVDDFVRGFKEIESEEIGSSITLFAKRPRCIYEIARKID